MFYVDLVTAYRSISLPYWAAFFYCQVAMSTNKDETPLMRNGCPELPSSRLVDQDSSSEVAKQISVLPSVVVGKILSYLSWKDKLSAAAAIPFWSDHLRTPDAWQWFCMDDVYASNDRQIDQLSKVNEMTRWCIRHYGHFFQNCIVLLCCTDESAFQLLDDIKTYCKNIKTLRIHHATRTRFTNQEQLDKYVSALKQVITECRAVHYFTLCNIDYVPFNCLEGLTELLRSLAVEPLVKAIKELELYHVNNTVLRIVHLASFVNLRKLMCPIQVLNTEIVVALKNLRQLFLINSSDTTFGISFCEVHRLNWQAIETVHPALQVHYMYWTFLQKSLIVPNPLARSVIIGERCEYPACIHEVIVAIAESYGKTLRRFIQQSTFCISKNELPSLYAMLVKGCPLLHTFLVSVPIPAAAVSLIAANRRLRNLWVQDEKISFKFYPRSETCKYRPYDDVEYVDWWETTIGSLDSLQQQLTKFLGFPWKPLDDVEMMEKIRMLTRF